MSVLKLINLMGFMLILRFSTVFARLQANLSYLIVVDFRLGLTTADVDAAAVWARVLNVTAKWLVPSYFNQQRVQLRTWSWSGRV